MRAEAARLLEGADPGNADSVFRAGAKAVKAELEAEALPLLRAGVTRHPADARLWQLIGLACRNLEQPEEALAAMDKAAALAPADALIAHTHARVTLEAGLPAADLFDRAHRISPRDGDVLLGRAAALLADGRIEDAITGLDAQLAANPAWLAGHGSAARLRWLNGAGKSFAASFERATARAPREAAIWRHWIDTLIQAGRYEAARAVLDRARVAAVPGIPFDLLATICLAELGDIGAADRMFAALGPIRDASLAIRYVRHLLRAGRPDEASAFAEPWTAGADADAIWPYLAVAWRLTGDPRWQWLEGDPHFVGIYDLGHAIPSLDALAAVLRGLHLETHQPLEQSVRGGTQTDGPLFARLEPEVRTLRKAIVEAVRAHIAQLPPPDPAHPLLRHRRDRAIRFSGSWSVRLAGGGRHANHLHPAGWLSSAFYVALPAVEEADPHAGWLTLGEPQAEMGLDLAPFRMIEPKPGRLALFPSTMWHGTRPFAAGERLTVAFDVAHPHP